MNESKPFVIVESLSSSQIQQLHQLTTQQWWGKQRSLDDIRIMLEHTSLILAVIDEQTGDLAGFCRVLTDFVFRATIFDVMVDDQHQGRGLGKRLIDALTDHPKLRRVAAIYLACEPNLEPFYQRWGFSPFNGRTGWMVKVQRPE
ncbi:GNAT family N-acetyltransferase [Stieleria sp. TO1_6]|uniref:GNAT family N-acetyltransferase n=1 Tax=Stieleria tagensis TaxID=2956795 RepID=UPI00209AE919|nr:GNAT family N-acetyltransferase [Stieleria tagensis]MCO8124766.1 GNAT family N-acetyltransferase [Stieleria tagensis]